MENNKSKKKLLSIAGFAIVVMALLGITYAFFSYTKTGGSNTISVGRIAFNSNQSTISITNFSPISSEDALTDTDNVGVLTVHITGDTEYDSGIEYLLSAVDVNNTINGKTIPIRTIVTYEASDNKDIGTLDSDYFTNRGGDTSIYKVLASDTITTDGKLVVGYIAPDQTGIDGTVTIRAYVDEEDIIVSNTYSETTDKVVLTTQEWNSFQGNNALSFRIKVEANDGVWVPNVSNKYAISFLSEGGSSVTGIEVAQNDMIGEFPSNPTRSGYAFRGWYTAASDGTRVTEATQVTGDMVLHAQWDKLVCVKATSRHQETCVSGSRCASAGWSAGGMIDYGTIPGNSSPNSGDAYDCDVNNNGDYTESNTYTERFYFMRVDSTTKNASLVYYRSFDASGPMDDSSERLIYKYDAGKAFLPTSTLWSNPALVTIDGRVSRYISHDDLTVACGTPVYDTNGYIDNCQYLLEVSKFHNKNAGRSGIWVEMKGSQEYRIDTRESKVALVTDSSNMVRPVIEIPGTLVEGGKGVYHVTFDSQGGSIVNGKDVTGGSQLGALPNNPIKANHIFVGWYTTPSYTKEVTSSTIIESDRTFYAKWEEGVTNISVVTLNVGDGSIETSELQIENGSAVGTIPTPTPSDGYIFDAWYNQDYSVRYNEETIVNTNMTFYARYAPSTKHVEMNGSYYDTVHTAVNTATTDKTTIRLLQDVTYTTMIDLYNNNTTKDIVLDLNGHTITNNTTNIVRTKTKLEVKNGTLKTSAGSGAIDVEGANGKLVMNSGTIEATGSRQAIYANGGTAELGGTIELIAKAQVDSNNKRGTVQCLGNCKLTITGGTIISNGGGGIALGISAGTVIIGTKDDSYDTSNIIIRGDTNGIYSTVNYELYDGLIEGVTAAVNDISIITTEDGATRNEATETETIGSKTYYKLYYHLPENYNLNFTTYGGTVSPLSQTITVGDTVNSSSLPTPTWTNKTFGGWYLDSDFTEPVPNVIAPLTSGSGAIYAKWTYTPASSLVNFDTTNAVMTTYFNNISTWKNLSETDFNTQMSTNFNNNNCSACDGANSCNSPGAGTYCDKPKVYDTNTSSALNVYLYDETTHVIGKKVEYTLSSNGTLSNLIPGQSYYWEKASDPTVNGHVVATTPRRNVDAGNVRNVRDLGGMSISYTENNVTKTGTLKYGRLFRGARLTSSNDDITSLSNLGVTREIDLRANSESSGQVWLPTHDNGSNGSDIIITNYLINPTATSFISTAHLSDYRNLKAAMKTVMRYVVAGDNIFFHCTIGSDRTGTIAYFLEGLLGVGEEDRLEDYELSFFYGMTNRTRYHDYLSGSSINPRFTSMYKSYPTYQDIYNFYKFEPESDDDTLLADFRYAMINFNS